MNASSRCRWFPLAKVLVILSCAGWLLGCNGAENHGPAAGGAVYYTAAGGSDEGPGDAGRPFRTIAKALEAARPGDRVVVRAGLYNETVAPGRSGAPGRPIVVEGERGPKGEFLTIVDSSMPFKAKWVPADEVGPGVFKARIPASEPYLMLVDGKFIPRIWPSHMKDGEGFRRLAYPPDQTVTQQIARGTVRFWDTVGAMFGCGTNGMVYLRFRDRDDPNGKDLRMAPAGGAVAITDQSHLVFRNLLVRGGQHCVLIQGTNAAHNIIEQCRIANGSARVDLQNGAAHNIIRDNEMTIDFYAETCRTGAWGWAPVKDENIPYELCLKGHFYEVYKLFFGPRGTYDYGVRLSNAGSGNEICGNHIHGGGTGIAITQTKDVKVHDNRVYGFSSIGLLATMNRTVNVQLYDNLVYDCNINIRIHHVNEPGQTGPRSLFVYRNRLWQKPGVGTHVFFHYHPKNDVSDYKHAAIFLYHNSMAGGRYGVSPSGYILACGGDIVVLNNIIAGASAAVYGQSNFLKAARLWEAFDYNWVYKQGEVYCPCIKAPWFGPHNIHDEGDPLWDPARLPDFGLPEGSTALNAGLDLSKPFRMNGRDYPALPGLKRSYFTGERPDLGAVQRRAPGL